MILQVLEEFQRTTGLEKSQIIDNILKIPTIKEGYDKIKEESVITLF